MSKPANRGLQMKRRDMNMSAQERGEPLPFVQCVATNETRGSGRTRSRKGARCHRMMTKDYVAAVGGPYCTQHTEQLQNIQKSVDRIAENKRKLRAKYDSGPLPLYDD